EHRGDHVVQPPAGDGDRGGAGHSVLLGVWCGPLVGDRPGESGPVFLRAGHQTAASGSRSQRNRRGLSSNSVTNRRTLSRSPGGWLSGSTACPVVVGMMTS